MKPPESLDQRLVRLSRVNSATGCWEWQGTLSNGYGRMFIGSRADGSRRAARAHRVSFAVFCEAVPEGLAVLHRCDNRACINPQHLFVGTWKDNADDRDAKGRGKPLAHFSGERASNAKLTDAQVAMIRASGWPSSRVAPLFGVTDGHIRSLRRHECFPYPPERE